MVASLKWLGVTMKISKCWKDQRVKTMTLKVITKANDNEKYNADSLI